MSRRRPPLPLTIAGSDPSGGAGLQADLKVFLHYGLSGAAVPASLTVQSTTGVLSCETLPPAFVKRQLEALLADMRPAAVKVGLLGNAQLARVVARTLGPLARRRVPIVIDPVLIASDGSRLMPEEDVAVFVRQLLPLATLLTPNVAEAAELAGVEEDEVRQQTEQVIRRLMQMGARNVLVKGGHVASEEATDILGTPDELIVFSLPRVPRRRHVHGTGCALSSAVTALLARGETLETAVQLAKEYVHAAIRGARHYGRGARMLDFLGIAQE
jgi:hydroxymethylpyrimidine/phosphomethylpyrimidine kinase